MRLGEFLALMPLHQSLEFLQAFPANSESHIKKEPGRHRSTGARAAWARHWMASSWATSSRVKIFKRSGSAGMPRILAAAVWTRLSLQHGAHQHAVIRSAGHYL